MRALFFSKFYSSSFFFVPAALLIRDDKTKGCYAMTVSDFYTILYTHRKVASEKYKYYECGARTYALLQTAFSLCVQYTFVLVGTRESCR